MTVIVNMDYSLIYPCPKRNKLLLMLQKPPVLLLLQLLRHNHLLPNAAHLCSFQRYHLFTNLPDRSSMHKWMNPSGRSGLTALQGGKIAYLKWIIETVYEWDNLASWIVTNGLYSENAVWLIQPLQRLSFFILQRR